MKFLWQKFRYIIWGFLWILGTCFILIYPIRWISGDYLAPIRITFYLLPWIFFLLIPALIVAILAQRKWLIITLVISIAIISITIAPLFVPKSPATDQPHNLLLKVMSHNLFYTQNAEAFRTLILQEQPDILLLQEVHPDLLSLPLAELSANYPHLYTDVVNKPELGFIQAILSRYPIHHISAEFDKGRTQKAIVETPAGPIAIWNVHVIPPFRISTKWHDQQTIALAADIAQVSVPLIVGGDFNATNYSTSYYNINQHVDSAHQQVGQGFGFTFPAPPHKIDELPFHTGLLYRLDHIFYSSHFIPLQAETIPDGAGSDHLPIITILSLKMP